MKRIHFIAIGGAIMHQLAISMHHLGNVVSGSDDEITEPAKSNLENEGLLPSKVGWYPEKISRNVDLIVLGMHAKSNNPELLAAKEYGLKIYSFPELIYEECKNKCRVVVAGSHGKTTITAMIMHILKCNGIEFDFLVGAKIEGFQYSVQISQAPIVILEGDEYPASAEEKIPKIFFYKPNITVLSGIAWDHINVFPTYEYYFQQFETYVQRLEVGATLIYNEEDSEVKRVVMFGKNGLNFIPYNTPLYRYENGTAYLKTNFGDIELSIFGRHNILNTQAAVKVCMELGISEERCIRAVGSFKGAARRLQKIATNENVVIYQDFAHAPSKLKATIEAVREAYPHSLLIACFELHTYSSLNPEFLNEYAHAMDDTDKALVFYSAHALEIKGLPQLNSEEVKKYFERDDLIIYDNSEELFSGVKALVENQKKHVLLLIMSSGTFEGIDWKTLCSQKNER